MIQKMPKPDRPYFIFCGKSWEIESEFNGRVSEISFENINKTALVDPDIGFNTPHDALIITETVNVAISGDFDEPEISMFTRNRGTLVGKNRGRNGDIPEFAPLALPLYHIEKLVKEAIKIDAEHRKEKSEFSPKFRKMLEEIHAERQYRKGDMLE